jgi:hypothetical protein
MRKIVVNQVTLCADGSIGVQLMKQIVDAGEVVSEQPHRFAIDIDVDMKEQFDAVNSDLVQRGYPEMDPKELDRVRKIDAIGRADRQISMVRAAKLKARADMAKAAE